jgi:hypothetical protein
MGLGEEPFRETDIPGEWLASFRCVLHLIPFFFIRNNTVFEFDAPRRIK